MALKRNGGIGRMAGDWMPLKIYTLAHVRTNRPARPLRWSEPANDPWKLSGDLPSGPGGGHLSHIILPVTTPM
jgi:hypothetical protein